MLEFLVDNIFVVFAGKIFLAIYSPSKTLNWETYSWYKPNITPVEKNTSAKETSFLDLKLLAVTSTLA